MCGLSCQQHQRLAQAAQVQLSHPLQAKLKYAAICTANTLFIANTVVIDTNALQQTEKAMGAATIVIHESGLYQRLTLQSGAKGPCHKMMTFLIHNNRNMLRNMHPIIITQARAFLSPIKPEGLPAAAEGELLPLAT